ncbi:ATP-binding protein [Elusimicrobiota bacterium]
MRLRAKFSFLTCSLAVLIVIGVSFFFYITEKQVLLKEMKESQINTVQGLANVGKESLITSNEILTINYLSQVKQTPGVGHAMITALDGEILAHTNIEQLGKKAKEPQDRREIFSVTHPISINDRTVATAMVGFSRSFLDKKIHEALKNTRKRIFGVAALGLLIGFLGAVILSLMMTNPIKIMAAGAASIGEGKLDTVIKVRSKDELGTLAADLNKMAHKLAELDRMKQDFIASITHEFRSPLNAMAIHFDLLSKEKMGELNEKQKSSFNILKKNAKRLELFINDLLDIAKIERGKMEINNMDFELLPVINEIRDLYKVQADKKSIVIKTELPGELPDAYADPDRTRQILTNLINNAIKFTGANGSITLNVVLNDNNFIQVSVQDTGMGIPENQLNSIFNKFEQVKGVRTSLTGQKGTGLGLSIVKGIVEGQGGKIWVESEENKGSTFYFTLPVVKEH